MGAVGKAIASFLIVCAGLLAANVCGFLIELVYLLITPSDILSAHRPGGTLVGFVCGILGCVFAASWIEAAFGEDYARGMIAWVAAIPLLLMVLTCFYIVQDNGGRELLDWTWIGWITEFVTCAGMGLLMRTVLWDYRKDRPNAGVF